MLARILVKPFGGIWNLRKACKSKSRFMRASAQHLYNLYQFEFGSSIAWNASFQSEPCFPHGMLGIFVSGGAEIGLNCIIFQQVTIGSITLLDSKGRGAPVIGDNVYIGAGAKIIGSVRVGDNVRIGANTVVYKDVPDNCVVVSGKQRVIHRDEPVENHFYSFRGGQWVVFDQGQFVPVLDQKKISDLAEM